MAFVKNHGCVLNLRRGDRGFDSVRLYDNPVYGTTNGIYAELTTSADAEAVIGSLSSLVDGGFSSYSGEMGRYYNDSFIAPNDTTGDAKGRAFVVNFAEGNKKANIYIPGVLNTKVEDVATVLKGLAWKDETGSKLTVNTVEVKVAI